MSFCTDLPKTEIAILSTHRRFEGCLEVEEWLKTGEKGHSFRAWLSLKLLPSFLVVLLIRDKATCYLIKVVTMRKLLISVAKMMKLWLGIVQHLVRWPPFFIWLLRSACLRKHWYKIWEKSIWYFYHARATLRQDPWFELLVIFDFFAPSYRKGREASSVKISEKNSKEKLVKCATEVGRLHKVSIQSCTQNRLSPKVQSRSGDWI